MFSCKSWKRILSVFMVLIMLMAFLPACTKTDTVSYINDTSVNYGSDEDSDDDDDIIIDTNDNGNSGSGGAVSYDSTGALQTHEIDESKKSDFRETIPKNLSGKTVKILTWWKPGVSEIKKMEYFTQKTGIKIKWVQTDLDVYYQKLSGLQAQQNSPDLAAILPENFPTAIMKNYFQPLSVGKLDLSKTEVFDIDSMNMFKWDGKYYGALIKGSTMITFGFLVYNNDMFKKSGITSPYDLNKAGKWNWDTLLSTAQQIQSKTGKPALTAEYQGFRLVQTVGQDAVKIENGKLVNNLSNTVYRNAWKWVDNLEKLKGQYKVADWGLNRDGFFNQKCAMAIEENWAMQKGERYENLKFSYGYVPLPCPAGQKLVIPSDAKLWGFPTGSKNAEAASYALEYWQNPVYDVKGSETWTNDSVAEFNDWLWEQPKAFKISQGIFNYGGDYEYYKDLVGDLALNGSSNVDSVADKWSAVIEGNIKKIYDEFD